MMRPFLLFACLTLMAEGAFAQESEGAKVALVVGVNEYVGDLSNLSYAENDAEQMAKVLGENGYTVVLLTTRLGKSDASKSPTAANIRKALTEAVTGRDPRDLVLVALAGHGMEVDVADPEGKLPNRTYPYFCPSDFSKAGIRYETGNAPQALNLNWVFEQFAASRAGRKVVLVDACRNLVKAKAAERSINAKNVTVPNGVCAMFSCSHDQVAFEIEGLGGRGHGAFFHHVLEGMAGAARNPVGAVTWGALSEHVAGSVPKTVRDAVGRTQTPHQVMNAVGVVVLLPGRLPSPPIPSPPKPPITLPGEEEYQKGMDYYMARRGTYDLNLANTWLKKASDLEHPLAQGRYALHLFLGNGVSTDKVAAQRLAGSCLSAVKDQANSHPDAANLLAVLHEVGLGVDRNPEEAARLFRVAAKDGHPLALASLGYMHARGVHVEKNDVEAVRFFRLASEKREPSSLCNLGAHYENGWGVTRDLAEAVRLYRIAADLGHPFSMNCLGNCYGQGVGVTANPATAAHWYQLAADRGFTEAMFALGSLHYNGRGVPKDSKVAAQWYAKAAEQGHPTALFNLALQYQDGNGVPQDLKHSIHLYRLAAAKGQPHAKNNLGTGFRDGRGVERNDAEAVRWFRASADQGIPEAMNNLGQMYFDGRGVPKDDRESARLHRASAEGGYPWGMYEFALRCEDGHGVPQSDRDAVYWYRQAADKGVPQAMNNLGLMYLNGRGVPRDYSEAMRLFRLAASQNVAVAMRNLGNMFSQGRGVPRDVKEAIRWYRMAVGQGDAESRAALRRLGVRD